MATDGKFNSAKVPVPRQSKHNLGNHWVGTLSWGRLHPIYVKDVAPGEVIHYKPNILVQTPAFASLTFAGIKVKQFSFFVPKRLLWSDFQSFIVGGSDGRSVWTPPKCYLSDLTAACCLEQSSKADLVDIGFSCCESTGSSTWPDWYHSFSISNFHYTRGFFSSVVSSFGLPVFPPTDIELSSVSVSRYFANKRIELMPFRAYQKVWWDWFRDSSLVPESLKDSYLFTDGGIHPWLNGVSTAGKFESYINIGASGSQAPQFLYEIQSRNICYDKDYFTTARLSPQAGLPSIVSVPLPDSVDFEYIGTDQTDGGELTSVSTVGSRINFVGYSFENGTIDLSSASSSFNVETFRLANSLQRFLERSNVTGTRPLAQLLGRFGVAPSAARLDMAEFVGGTERELTPQQVISTAATDAKSLGERAAFGRLFFPAEKQTYRANEHGIFISLLAIVPNVEYCDGIDRMWQLDTKEDYFQPEYENLGFEAIFNHEVGSNLFYSGHLPDPMYYDQAWGYVPRYSWMKWKRSVLAGDFVRPDTALNNDSWHSFRRENKANVQYLNPDFVEVHTNDGYNNWNRLFADTSNDYDPFTVDVWNENDAVLPMEGYVTPGLSSVYEMDGRRIRIPYGGFRM